MLADYPGVSASTDSGILLEPSSKVGDLIASILPQRIAG